MGRSMLTGVKTQLCVVCLSLACTLIWRTCAAAAPTEGSAPTPEQLILRSFMHRVPDRAAKLVQYGESIGIGRDGVEAILVRFVRDGVFVPPEEDANDFPEVDRRSIREMVILCLGDIGSRDAVPMLRKMGFSPSADDQLRLAVIRACTRIGGPDLLDFARQVVSARAFNAPDHQVLYEELSPYVGLVTWTARLLDTNSPSFHKGTEAEREAVTKFFREMAQREAFFSSILTLDERLCLVDATWRQSHEREAALKKMVHLIDLSEKEGRGGWSEGSEYAARELRLLKEMWVESRTHVQVPDEKDVARGAQTGEAPTNASTPPAAITKPTVPERAPVCPSSRTRILLSVLFLAVVAICAAALWRKKMRR